MTDILTNDEFISVLLAEIDKRKTIAAFAREVGYSSAYVCQVLGGRYPASNGLAKQIGYERVHMFVKRSDSTDDAD